MVMHVTLFVLRFLLRNLLKIDRQTGRRGMTCVLYSFSFVRIKLLIYKLFGWYLLHVSVDMPQKKYYELKTLSIHHIFMND